MTLAADIIASPFELAARQFELVIRKLADDLTYGADASRFVGPGIDYAQSRPYVLGDSIRSIDWKVTARTGQYHVKDYEAPKRVPVYIVVDTSASMGVSSQPVSKHAAGVWIAGALALVAFRRRSPVALISGGERELAPKPTLVRSQVWGWINALREPGLAEATMLTERINRVEEVADRTSLLIVVSDLHAPNAVETIKRFRQRHDCLVVQLADPAELGRLRAGFMRAAEAETGSAFFAHGRSRFFSEGNGIERAGRELAEGAVDHVLVRTDESFIVPLRQALSARGGGRRVAR